jgi:hypothetical protein
LLQNARKRDNNIRWSCLPKKKEVSGYFFLGLWEMYVTFVIFVSTAPLAPGNFGGGSTGPNPLPRGDPPPTGGLRAPERKKTPRRQELEAKGKYLLARSPLEIEQKKARLCVPLCGRSEESGSRQQLAAGPTPWTLAITEPQKWCFFGIQLKKIQSHALQSSSRFSARREASESESAKQIKFG